MTGGKEPSQSRSHSADKGGVQKGEELLAVGSLRVPAAACRENQRTRPRVRSGTNIKLKFGNLDSNPNSVTNRLGDSAQVTLHRDTSLNLNVPVIWAHASVLGASILI